MRQAIHVITSLFFAVPLPALAASPFDGTWKADMATAQLPKKPEIYLLQNGIFACKSCAPPFAVKADGKPHAITGHPYEDAVAFRTVDAHSFEMIGWKAGKMVSKVIYTISPDAKDFTTVYSDSSASTAAPVTGTSHARLVAAGPAGSAAISGSWQYTTTSSSDNGVTATYKMDGGRLKMSSPTGQSYDVKLDGPEAPYLGDPGTSTVKVKKLGARTIEETDFRAGTVTGIMKMTVLADGKVANFVYTDKLHGSTMSFKANRQ